MRCNSAKFFSKSNQVFVYGTGRWQLSWVLGTIINQPHFLVIMYRSIEQKIQVSYDCVPTKYLGQPKYRFNCYLFRRLEVIIFALLLRIKCPIWAYRTNTEVPWLGSLPSFSLFHWIAKCNIWTIRSCGLVFNDNCVYGGSSCVLFVWKNFLLGTAFFFIGCAFLISLI